MNPESDEEFEAAPRVNKSTPYARSTHSSASKTFGAGDDDIDDEVNFKDAGSAGKGGDDSVPSPTVVDKSLCTRLSWFALLPGSASVM